MRAFHLLMIVASLATWLPSFAQELPVSATVTKRQVIFLREGLDSIFGNAVFLVENRSETDAPLKTIAMLPKETVDFAATEGIDPQDIKLDGTNVVIERAVPPGVHMIGIGFQTSAKFGRATLSFTVTEPIDNLSILVPEESKLELQSAALQPADDGETPHEGYRPYANRAPMQPGDRFTIEVTGLPEGRAGLWILGAVIAGLIVVSAFTLAWRTRPKIEDDGGQALLVN